jgi:3-oxoacyl-[acyl-carrier protein] reductase
MELKNGVCIVTGSATGIGAACAIDLAKKGCNVVINYTKSEGEAKATVAECEKLGVGALLVQANIAIDADCQRMADAAQDFHDIYAVNVIGTFQMIRAVEPTMRKQGHGAIVNVSSIAGVMGTGTSVAYAASKGALNTMTLSLARVLGPQIRVNAVCPGFVETRWLQGALGARYEDQRTKIAERTPLGKTSTPEDISRAVVWLLEGADLVTGEFIIVDGGAHLSGAPAKAR